jgi:hypothetical protein
LNWLITAFGWYLSNFTLTLDCLFFYLSKSQIRVIRGTGMGNEVSI